MNDVNPNTVAAAEAAKRLGITRQGLSYLVKKGEIRPQENIESKYKFFNEEAIRTYQKKRGERKS